MVKRGVTVKRGVVVKRGVMVKRGVTGKPGVIVKRSARTVLALLCAIALTLVGASTVWAHAQLVGTSPTTGTTVATQPQEVIFEFNQNVGGTLGAVRVYDAQGNEVDNLDVTHPNGQEHWMSVGLKPGLPDGTYTATYRVISADTHIVYGGLLFNIGHPGAAPKFTVAGLIERNESGEVTVLAFGAVRALDYLAIALMLGGLAFLLLTWRPAFAAVAAASDRAREDDESEAGARVGAGTGTGTGAAAAAGAGAGAEWQSAARAFEARMARLLAVAVVLGFSVSVLGILLQGASAAGVSLWASLKRAILESTLESRFGWVWGLRAIDWILLGVLLSVAATLRRRTLTSTPAASDRVSASAATTSTVLPQRWLLAPITLSVAYLAATPALGGHASIQSPTAVFFPSDFLHVLAASVWVGGIICLLLVLPRATRRLPVPDRSRLLLATLAHFSPLALGAVVAIAVTGVVQAYIDVRSLHALFHTTYGALIIVKVVLLLGLIACGWINRERVIPALERVAATRRAPGGVGVLARRTMRSELTLMLVVFGVTAALVSYAPPIDAAGGPFSTNTTLGPAELELTVEPAEVGLNTVHLYLIDAKTGSQFTATKELVVKAELPAKGIGPLPLHAIPAGPGHYILSSADLSPAGTWEIQFTDRVSEFEEFTRNVKVPIR